MSDSGTSSRPSSAESTAPLPVVLVASSVVPLVSSSVGLDVLASSS
jgi:hypothetical protein